MVAASAHQSVAELLKCERTIFLGRGEKRRDCEGGAAGGGGTSSQAALRLMQRMRRQHDDIQMARPHLDLALKCGRIHRGERRRGPLNNYASVYLQHPVAAAALAE